MNLQIYLSLQEAWQTSSAFSADNFKIRECWRVLALSLSTDKRRLLLLKNRILTTMLTSRLIGQNCDSKMKTELEWMTVGNILFASFQTTKTFISRRVIVLLIGDKDDLNSYFLTTRMTSNKKCWKLHHQMSTIFNFLNRLVLMWSWKIGLCFQVWRR